MLVKKYQEYSKVFKEVDQDAFSKLKNQFEQKLHF